MSLINVFANIVSEGKLLNIIKGCNYHFLVKNFSTLSPEIEMLGTYRIGKCDGCEVREKSYCSNEKKGKAVIDFKYGTEFRVKGVEYEGCGCYLNCKTLVSAEICPLGKWLNTT